MHGIQLNKISIPTFTQQHDERHDTTLCRNYSIKPV